MKQAILIGMIVIFVAIGLFVGYKVGVASVEKKIVDRYNAIMDGQSDWQYKEDVTDVFEKLYGQSAYFDKDEGWG